MESPSPQKPLDQLKSFLSYLNYMISDESPRRIAERERLEALRSDPNACASCYTKLDTDAKFCPSCSKPVVIDTSLKCPKCGENISAGSKFCKFCAANLSQTTSSDSLVRQGSSNAGTLITLGVVVGIVSGLAHLWGRSYMNDVRNVMSAGFSSMVGRQDSTYELAQIAVPLGGIGICVAAFLLLAGFLRK